MPQRITSASRTGLTSRFLAARTAVARELPGALDRMAALASEAREANDLATAAASAGATVLVEHLQWAAHRHTPTMLTILAAAGPAAASMDVDGLFAWAGAAVAHDYGVLPSWPPADIAELMERADQAPTDAALALGCALGEVCERNGKDSEFATLVAQISAFEVHVDASPFWRGHWSIACAWHLQSFGKMSEAVQRLELAQELAAAHGLLALGATTALQRARLIECRRDPVNAARLVDEALAQGDPERTPLWWADGADVHCCVALNALDFQAAVGHARRAIGYARAAAVWPGYQVPYQVNEAYALLGTGAVEEALVRFNEIRETPMPRYQAARLQCLADLVALSATDRNGLWNDATQADLAKVLRRLRELEWASVLPMLPEYIALLFARALAGGLEVDWVRTAIRTRALAAPRGAPEAWPWSVKVRTLGAFEVATESGPLRQASADARKASSKPLDLLRFLAAHGHAAVPTDVVAEALWPGAGREGRNKALEITTSRLRRLLGSDAAVPVGDRRIGLSGQCVWSDVQALTDCLAEGEAVEPGSAALGKCVEAALALYRGPCLTNFRHPWAVAAGDRVRGRLAALLLRAIRSPAVLASQRREWIMRAASSDPLIGLLLGKDAVVAS